MSAEHNIGNIGSEALVQQGENLTQINIGTLQLLVQNSATLPEVIEAIKKRQQDSPDPRRFQPILADLQDRAAAQQAPASNLDQLVERRREETADESARRLLRSGHRIVGAAPIGLLDTFYDREDELRRISALLANPSTRVVSIHGRPGLGKTALACKVLANLAEGRWPHTDERLHVDGIIYLSTRSNGISLERFVLACGEMLGGEAESTILTAWSSSSLDSTEKINVVLDSLHAGLYLILLDNVEDLLDEMARFADPEIAIIFNRILTGGHGARILLTTRRRLAFEISTMRLDICIQLDDGLPIDDAVEMLRALDPNGEYLLRDAPWQQLANAAAKVYRIPRALEMIGGILARDPAAKLESVISNFYKQEDVMGQLVAATQSRIDPASRLVLQALAVLRRAVEPLAVRYMLKEFNLEVEPILHHLAKSHIIKFDRERCEVSLHPFDQEYLYTRIPDEGNPTRQQLELRAADYYARLRVDRDHWHSVLDLAAHLLEFDHRISGEDYTGAAEILAQVADFMAWHGQPRRIRAMHASLAEKATNERFQMLMSYALGHSYILLGPMEKALNSLTTAAAIARDLGDIRIERDSLGWIGETYRRLGRLDQAIEMLSTAVQLYVGTSDGVQGCFLLDLSLACSYNGKLREAVAYARNLMSLSDTLGDKYMKAQAHNALSIAYLISNRLAVALEHVEAALSIYEREIERGPVGSLDPMGYVLNTQGMIELRQSKFDQAAVTLQRGREIGRQLEGPRVEGFCLFNYARGLNMLGRKSEAVTAAESAASLLTQTGAPEAHAAMALAEAIRAAEAEDGKSEARFLLACASVSLTSPDILCPADLLKRAKLLADREGLRDVADAVRSSMMDLDRLETLLPLDFQESVDVR